MRYKILDIMNKKVLKLKKNMQMNQELFTSELESKSASEEANIINMHSELRRFYCHPNVMRHI